MNSIVQDDTGRCYLCGSRIGLERHHIFAGTANRRVSERLGLWVMLCHKCHTGTEGAQYDPIKNKRLKMDAQYAYERTHTRLEWMREIGKNYL